MKEPLIHPLGVANIIRDESQFFGYAFSASSPNNAAEVSEIVLQCKKTGETITPHGGLTGINGAGAASNNHTMSLQRLTHLEYRETDHTLWAEAGATFASIETAIRKESNMTREFPASPTEKSATIGGAISFGALGLRSYKYGNVSSFVTEIEYCDCHGNIQTCDTNSPEIHSLFATEGMCAIITGVRLKTTPIPDVLWGVMIFFPDSLKAAQFSDAICDQKSISVLELLDANSFSIIEEYRSTISAIGRIPNIPSMQQAAIYIELEGSSEEELTTVAEGLLELTEKYNGDSDNIWTVMGDEVESLRLLRHTISECINLKIAEYHRHDIRIKKLSCSCFFPQKTREEIIKYYQNDLADTNLSGIIFGHIGSKKPYVNILPTTNEEYYIAKSLIERWCKDAFSSGGSAFSECGVGKLYRNIFCNTAPIDLLSRRIKLKQKWDPTQLFNPGNMFVNTHIE